MDREADGEMPGDGQRDPTEKQDGDNESAEGEFRDHFERKRGSTKKKIRFLTTDFTDDHG
jgi:hypothetical protein